MTALSTPVRRLTAAKYCSKQIVVILAACGAQSEARIGVRIKGRRTSYTATVSDFYRWAAQSYASKERIAKKTARKNGIKWAVAKRKFASEQSI